MGVSASCSSWTGNVQWVSDVPSWRVDMDPGVTASHAPPGAWSHLYHVAREIEGGRDAEEQEVQDRAALIFGLFVWECIMLRDEEWMVYDPNLSSRDPNREITGKVYFEQS